MNTVQQPNIKYDTKYRQQNFLHLVIPKTTSFHFFRTKIVSKSFFSKSISLNKKKRVSKKFGNRKFDGTKKKNPEQVAFKKIKVCYVQHWLQNYLVLSFFFFP